MLQSVALLLLAGWTVATILLHLLPLVPPRPRRALERVTELDPFSLFTTWNLFAPQPAPGGFHLLLRHRLRTGELTPWRELPLTPERQLLHAVWHPRIRAGAALQGLGVTFCQPAALRGSARMLSMPYLALLNHAACQPGPPETDAVQFLLALTPSGGLDRTPRPLFLSGMHPVAGRSAATPAVKGEGR